MKSSNENVQLTWTRPISSAALPSVLEQISKMVNADNGLEIDLIYFYF